MKFLLLPLSSRLVPPLSHSNVVFVHEGRQEQTLNIPLMGDFVKLRARKGDTRRAYKVVPKQWKRPSRRVQKSTPHGKCLDSSASVCHWRRLATILVLSHTSATAEMIQVGSGSYSQRSPRRIRACVRAARMVLQAIPKHVPVSGRGSTIKVRRVAMSVERLQKENSDLSTVQSRIP